MKKRLSLRRTLLINYDVSNTAKRTIKRFKRTHNKLGKLIEYLIEDIGVRIEDRMMAGRLYHEILAKMYKEEFKIIYCSKEEIIKVSQYGKEPSRAGYLDINDCKIYLNESYSIERQLWVLMRLLINDSFCDYTATKSILGYLFKSEISRISHIDKGLLQLSMIRLPYNVTSANDKCNHTPAAVKAHKTVIEYKLKVRSIQRNTAKLAYRQYSNQMELLVNRLAYN